MISPPTSTPVATMTQVRFSMLDSNLIQTVRRLHPTATRAVANQAAAALSRFDRRPGSPHPNKAAVVRSDAIGFSHRFRCTKREGMTWASYPVAKIDGMHAPGVRHRECHFRPQVDVQGRSVGRPLLQAVEGGFHCRRRSMTSAPARSSAGAISMATK